MWLLPAYVSGICILELEKAPLVAVWIPVSGLSSRYIYTVTLAAKPLPVMVTWLPTCPEIVDKEILGSIVKLAGVVASPALVVAVIG